MVLAALASALYFAPISFQAGPTTFVSILWHTRQPLLPASASACSFVMTPASVATCTSDLVTGACALVAGFTSLAACTFALGPVTTGFATASGSAAFAATVSAG